MLTASRILFHAYNIDNFELMNFILNLIGKPITHHVCDYYLLDIVNGLNTANIFIKPISSVRAEAIASIQSPLDEELLQLLHTQCIIDPANALEYVQDMATIIY